LLTEFGLPADVFVDAVIVCFPEPSVHSVFRTYSLSRGTKQYSGIVQLWGLGGAYKAATLPANAASSAK